MIMKSLPNTTATTTIIGLLLLAVYVGAIWNELRYCRSGGPQIVQYAPNKSKMMGGGAQF